MRDLGTPVYSEDFFRAILMRFPDSASIAVVKLDNKAAAAAFLMRYRDRLEVPWGASLREYNRFKIYTYFTWEILKHAIGRGCAVYDFGRSTAGSGPHQFKKKWGAEDRQLYWHYWLRKGRDLPQLNPDNPKYRLAIKVWQRLPVWLANRLGPPIVQNLP
jgi:FemAB-related protein (PEP-CTERM system-associated)